MFEFRLDTVGTVSEGVESVGPQYRSRCDRYCGAPEQTVFSETLASFLASASGYNS